MPITIEPISDAVGAKVTGIDLCEEMSNKTFKIIHRASLKHQVLVFPGQKLEEEHQVRFTGRFGELGGRARNIPTAEGDNVSHPGTMLISNIRKDGKPIGSLPDGEMMFHSDGAYAKPYRYTLLFALEIPSVGGNTLFANMYKAYEALPDNLKILLKKCHAKHMYYAGSVLKDKPASDSLSGTRIHPLFIAHEETGRTALYASRLLTTRIEEMAPKESDAILEQLINAAEKSEVIYEHKWPPGDFVMWDNRCVNHARTDFSEGERRLLRRTTVVGVDPVPATGN